jgi:hypothetical protein
MMKNIHIVNAEKLAVLIGLSASSSVKTILVKEWANEMRLACRFADKGAC